MEEKYKFIVKEDILEDIQILFIIIQHIVTMSKYGHNALNIRHATQQISCDIRNFVCRGQKW